jgi:hypothetical protein
MHDWDMFLNKFLRDTELPVLPGAGSMSHDEALIWAEEQYDAFIERRRLEAEAKAEKQYVEDLRASAQTLEAERKKRAVPKKAKPGKKRSGNARGGE